MFYHSCNFTGQFTDDAIRMMAKFPMVTIEKGQGVADPNDHRYAEDKIIDTLRRVKALDSNISTLFYYNSAKDWPFYRLHAEHLMHPEWWMKTKKGEVCHVSGDASFPNSTDMLVFDFAQAPVRDLFVSECVNMTQTGVVDGCFSDKVDKTSCDGNAEYKAGHLLVHQQIQEAIGNGPLVVNSHSPMDGVNSMMIELFRPNEDYIKKLIVAAGAGKLVQVHAGRGEKDCAKDITNSLSAFLIGAGRMSYFACSQGWSIQSDPIEHAWHSEYEKPLGEPTGPAVKDGKTYRREFSSARGTTVVTFNVRTNRGQIEWADGSVSQGIPEATEAQGSDAIVL